jgi:peptide chain release factor subunit 1
MVVFGVEDTMKALELGALDTLMLFEDLQINRYVLKNSVKGDTQVILLNPKQEQNEKNFIDQETGIAFEVQECEPLTEWLCQKYTQFGIKIELITDRSQEGYQFVKGFGGIGGFLRYKADIHLDLGGRTLIKGGDGDDDFEEEFK